MNLPKADFEIPGVAWLYCADCRDILPQIPKGCVNAVVTDPPYGIEYESGRTGYHGGTALPGIVGDLDTSLRDTALEGFDGTPMVVFGTRKRATPKNCRAILIWEKGDHVGMGDLGIPWKPNTEEIYIIGPGFSGHRGSSVIRVNAPVSWNSVGFGRTHPHEKPAELMDELISKCPPGNVLDPFMGSGTTGVAAIRLGRKFIGVEICEKYFQIACRRIQAAYDELALFTGEPIGQRLQQSGLFDERGDVR